MISTLLIANRGEIAVRVIRTCKEMGIRTVAVYSTADKDGLHVALADKAVCIGPPASRDSYLHIKNLISAAITTHCDAIHPGVGFLSENDTFAQAVRDAGLIFIGAEPETIRLLGNKVEARRLAEQYNIPTVPGTKEAVTPGPQAIQEAEAIGYPVIIKAAAGGGGRGMRIVRSSEELVENLKIAAHEAESNFADGTIYIEKYLESPRHVEVQVVADRERVVCLGERDCSVQRNHQKLLEESPSTATTQEMRHAMNMAAQKLFSSLGYVGAGTIEFLVEKDNFYFMEINARVQVEHPVSEMVTNTDIIRQQIIAASGGTMEFPSGLQEVPQSGYALECRVNALTPGKVSVFEPPLGAFVRTDTFLYSGAYVSPHYDSMVAKIIVWAPTREQGIDRMLRSLEELKIEGIKTNVDEQLSIITSREFRSGNFGTDVYGRLKESSRI